MYLSKIDISNFRNFKKQEIVFNDGVNVIIGHNNAGKTNLIKALALIFDNQTKKKLDIDDFNKGITLNELKANPPKIVITVTISKGEQENIADLATVGNWLTKLDTSYEAQLTYEFYLPEDKRLLYIETISKIESTKMIWKQIKHDFLRFYTYKIWCGDPAHKTVADSESLQKFDFQFLSAIRDVERDMFTGKDALLREVLDFFMDYEIKSLSEQSVSKEEKEAKITEKRKQFSETANPVLALLQERMKEGQKHILKYAQDTGASFNKATPEFEGSIADTEMLSALKLIIKYETGIEIPVTHNGLGYNNLIYMSLLLAKMQVHSNGNYMGNNAKVFPILAIEEPEAHLHPSMQFKFLKFLKENKKARQIFVSTHSTHIASAVSLDEIICLHNEDTETLVGYPGKVFLDSALDKKSKKYVQRFLDATKSDMLFAQRVILVEGLSEQLLLPVLARYMEDKSLEDYHVAIINIGGRYFNHFLNLFDTNKTAMAIPKKIACITDRDPERKQKLEGSRYEKCYPFEYMQDSTNYEYKNHAQALMTAYSSHPNIRYFSQDEHKGKTLEYDLVTHNPTQELLITETLANITELKSLMSCFQENKPIDDFYSKLSNNPENTRIKEGIQRFSSTSWSDNDKKNAIIASRYLNSVSKGENALDLAATLQDNLDKKDAENPVEQAEYKNIIVPEYIAQAINWICQ